MRRCVPALVVLLVIAMPLEAQSLRDNFTDLFRFGNCEEALCLDVDPAFHGEHYIPAAQQEGANLIDFLRNAIGVSVANIPISSTSSGATFTIQGGLPVRTSVSSGPVFAERAQTLGRGRFLIGANVSSVRLESVRGLPLEDLTLNFTHQNIDFNELGDPEFENDIIQVRTAIDVNLLVGSLFLSYGLLDRVDVGVALPLVRTSLSGTSFAQIIPFGPSSVHRFSESGNPLQGTASIEESATGIGDVAARLKINLHQSPRTGFAILTDARFPTGDEDDFLGAGDLAVRGLGIFSARYGDFAPHVNAGYLYRDGELQNDGILATIGFDHLLAPWATLAVELISEWQVGESELGLPEPVTFEAPFERTVLPSTIPDRRDDLLNGSLGFKLTTGGGVTLVLNSLFPLNEGGMRPDFVWTVGLEYAR